MATLSEPLLLSRTAFSPPASQPPSLRLPVNTFSMNSISQHTSNGFLPPTLRLYPGSPPLARTVPNLPQPSFRVLLQHYSRSIRNWGILIGNNDLSYLCYSYLENLEDQTFPSLLILLLVLVLFSVAGCMMFFADTSSFFPLLWFFLQLSRQILLMLCVNYSSHILRHFSSHYVILYATFLFALQASGYVMYALGWGLLLKIITTFVEEGNQKERSSTSIICFASLLLLFLSQLAETVLLGVRAALALEDSLRNRGPVEDWCPPRFQWLVRDFLMRGLENVTGEIRGGLREQEQLDTTFLQMIVDAPYVRNYLSLDDKQCPVCYEDFEQTENVLRVPCDGGHTFHEKCAMEWFHRGHFSCPVCRTSLIDRVVCDRGKDPF